MKVLFNISFAVYCNISRINQEKKAVKLLIITNWDRCNSKDSDKWSLVYTAEEKVGWTLQLSPTTSSKDRLDDYFQNHKGYPRPADSSSLRPVHTEGISTWIGAEYQRCSMQHIEITCAHSGDRSKESACCSKKLQEAFLGRSYFNRNHADLPKKRNVSAAATLVWMGPKAMTSTGIRLICQKEAQVDQG